MIVVVCFYLLFCCLGTVKLVSLSDAIKLAESGNFNVPTTVNKRLGMASQVREGRVPL